MLVEYAARSGTNHGQVTDALQLLLDAVRDAWAQAEATTISEGEAQRWSPVCNAAFALVKLADGGQ